MRYAGPVEAEPAPLRYTPVAVALHWMLAVALAASFACGLFMTELQNSPLKLRLYNWHKWPLIK